MILRLIAYDIVNDKCRNKIYDKLESQGFIAIQKSIFCGTHTPTQWQQCKAALYRIVEKYGNLEEDKIMAVVISKNCATDAEYIGKAQDLKELLHEPLTLWI